MNTDNFTGRCEATFMLNGNPTGEDFSADNLYFERRAFQAKQGVRVIQINYGEDLEPGTKPLVFSGREDDFPIFEYHDSQGRKRLSGTGEVTIGENLDHQKGSFDMTMVDNIGRLIAVKGVFDVSYEVKKS
ncbi:hypothetical protein [Pseudomonas koreensis]|uniref:hypothetical protein n=1 Tax=Pseudomonas koreensis TaxID=198620 RepID=UPI003F840B5F